jgi:hypothetical protein
MACWPIAGANSAWNGRALCLACRWHRSPNWCCRPSPGLKTPCSFVRTAASGLWCWCETLDRHGQAPKLKPHWLTPLEKRCTTWVTNAYVGLDFWARAPWGVLRSGTPFLVGWPVRTPIYRSLDRGSSAKFISSSHWSAANGSSVAAQTKVAADTFHCSSSAKGPAAQFNSSVSAMPASLPKAFSTLWAPARRIIHYYNVSRRDGQCEFYETGHSDH